VIWKDNIADKFNLYYIQNINNIVGSIDGGAYKKMIYVIIENKENIENFEMVGIENVERVIMKLSKKEGTEEGITNDILKQHFM